MDQLRFLSFNAIFLTFSRLKGTISRREGGFETCVYVLRT